MEKIASFRTLSPKSRAVAFILAFFLGAFGAHRFYLGKGGSAIAMLLLTCTIAGAIISAIWALIDCCVIAAGGMRDGNGFDVKTW